MYVIFSFLALYMHTGDHGKHVLSSRYIHKFNTQLKTCVNIERTVYCVVFCIS